MSFAKVMQVALRLPTRTLFSGEVIKLYAVAENGAFAMLPNHIDFVSALVPSVMVLTNQQQEEMFFAIDEGLLVKTGHQVEVAVWRGLQGEDLDALNKIIQSTFLAVDEDERVARTALSQLEAGLVRRFGDLRKPLL
ncbi:MAG: F0F1 ATP synthase subunit epsilon [Thiohalomonadaceae bacterium]|jgi:F-type H+-transporting ATPase subunit epsilon